MGSVHGYMDQTESHSEVRLAPQALFFVSLKLPQHTAQEHHIGPTLQETMMQKTQ